MRARFASLLVALAALAAAQPALADHGHGHGYGHVHVGVGVGWGGWWGYGPGWYGSGWYGPGWWGPGWWGAAWAGPGWYGPGYAPVAVQSVPSDVGTVDTDVSPEHARVFLDGQLIGIADDFDGNPSYLFLKPGHYALEFRLQGYRTATLDLDIKPGSYVPIDTKLVRVPGETAAPWWDRPKGLPVARVFGPRTEPAPGPGAVAAGPDTSLRVETREAPSQPPPAPLGGALDFQVTPANASVYLDGEFLGTASELLRLERGVAVGAGQHHLEVMAPGHASRSITVEVPAGEHRQVVVQLDPAAGQNS
jgi:hypothetical protein